MGVPTGKGYFVSREFKLISKYPWAYLPAFSAVPAQYVPVPKNEDKKWLKMMQGRIVPLASRRTFHCSTWESLQVRGS